MRKSAKIIGSALIGGIVLIQFFQPDRNLGKFNPGTDMLVVTNAPDSLASVLKNSCYNCHSNQTRYPWYGYIAPVSWYLDTHIQKAKADLNMSNFGGLDKKKKIGTLSKICEELESGSMPLKSYLLIHQEARLSKSEIKAICDWSEFTALKIMRE